MVTGGAGFIGATLVRRLLERGDSVTILDSGVAAGLGHVDALGEHARLISGDIRDTARIEQAVNGCDAAIHLAAQVNVPRSMDDPLGDLAVNVDGTVRLLEAARQHGIGRFIFASSNAAVGGHLPPMHEGLAPWPVSPYGAAKAAGEAYVHAYHSAYGREGVSLRFANAYGPWSAHKSSVVASFIRAWLGGGPLVLRGTGEQTRDFVHVDDVCRMIIACLDAPAEQVAGEVFQVGSGQETSLLELADLIFDVGGHGVPIEHEAPSAGDVARNYSDILKARRVLGWQPEVTLRDGIAQTLDWFRGHRRG